MTSYTFGGMGYRCRREMIEGAVSDWCYGKTNTDALVCEGFEQAGVEGAADEMIADGWIDEIRKSDPTVDRDDLIAAAGSVWAACTEE